jgi:hypothetical protein
MPKRNGWLILPLRLGSGLNCIDICKRIVATSTSYAWAKLRLVPTVVACDPHAVLCGACPDPSAVVNIK